jgi:deoxycytidylate deaminase
LSQTIEMADGAAVASLVRLATDSNAELVRKIVVDARAVAGDARILCATAFEPIAVIVCAAACGEMRQQQWRSSLVHALDEAVPARAPPPPKVRTIGGLMESLAARVPLEAHENRLCCALTEVEGILRGTARVPALLELLPSAVRLAHSYSRASTQSRNAESVCPAPLHERILDGLVRLTQSPLGMHGIVQAPFLASLSGDRGHGQCIECDKWSGEGGVALRTFLMAAELARRGDQRGAKHGCVIIEDGGGVVEVEAEGGEEIEAEDGKAVGARVLGEGWNHEVCEMRGAAPLKTRVLHAECHAVADAIRRCGEEGAFAAFRRATAWVVELRGEAAYDDAPPCRKCACLLRAIGVPRAVHSTREGNLKWVALSAPRRPELLSTGLASRPLMYACDAMGLRCERLERALSIQQLETDGQGSAQRAAPTTSSLAHEVVVEEQDEGEPHVAFPIEE